MSRADYYAEGDWNAVCYQCGRKRKASTMWKHWQGYWLCPEHWEARQPQDFVRAVPDQQAPPWIQAMPPDVFIGLCTPNGVSAVPGWAEPGCATPGYLSPAFDPNASY